MSNKNRRVNRFQSQEWDFSYSRIEPHELYNRLMSRPTGLTQAEAETKLRNFGLNQPVVSQSYQLLNELQRKLADPLIILLLVIATFTLIFSDPFTATVVYSMSALSVGLSIFQERKARVASDQLNKLIRTTTTVQRDGKESKIDLEEVVPGDIINLSAGDILSGDIRLIKTDGLFVDQSSLTGESFPVEKHADVQTDTSNPDAPHLAFMGTSVVSGTATGIVIHTGLYTDFGKLSAKLGDISTKTEFDREVKDFAWLLIRSIMVIALTIFIINAIKTHNFIEAIVLALSVSISIGPETLPMTIAINLSNGALAMARKKVIVKYLNAIQNFGAMDVLCTDKTGTLTMNKVVLEKHLDANGNESEAALKLGYVNSYFQTGLRNLIDEAVLKHKHISTRGYHKLGEIPFDFNRKIMSVVVASQESIRLITKGAPEEILARCTHYEVGGEVHNLKPRRTRLDNIFANLSNDGFRVLAIAYRHVPAQQQRFEPGDETKLIFAGFMAFLDPPKPTARKTIHSIEKMGITLKIITGDNELVSRKIAEQVGLKVVGVMIGTDIEPLSDNDLASRVENTNIFARVSPAQKERIVRVLHANNHVVGFLGDGINDATSLKTADIGISVNNAADIAKESASIILLEKDLAVLTDGIYEGRRVFGNFMKYIRITNGFNIGFMISMTISILILPIVPLAPLQILLNNYLYDMLQVAVPTDNIDQEYVLKPKHWDISHIYKYMLTLGPLNTLFDIVTWIVLWLVFDGFAKQQVFQTGWFLEILCTQLLAIYVIRTKKISFFQSKPSTVLVLTSLLLLAIGFILPYTKLATAFSLVKMPATFYLFLAVLLVTYLAVLRTAKNWLLLKLNTD